MKGNEIFCYEPRKDIPYGMVVNPAFTLDVWNMSEDMFLLTVELIKMKVQDASQEVALLNSDKIRKNIPQKLTPEFIAGLRQTEALGNESNRKAL